LLSANSPAITDQLAEEKKRAMSCYLVENQRPYSALVRTVDRRNRNSKSSPLNGGRRGTVRAHPPCSS
jgi:hypothetical protein